jgi:Uma2 family endonuclease
MSTAVLPTPSVAAATSQLLTENWLRNVFSPDLYTVRGRDERAVATDPGLVPDIAVVAVGAEQQPFLAIEIADSDVAAEIEKAGRYAAAGVRDYWVLDVVERRLHVFRDPQPDPDARHGYSYKRSGVLPPSSLIAPVMAELHLVQVIDLLS